MNKLGFYRILTLILLPIAILFAVFVLMLLFIALANPSMLLPLFTLACVVIYIFTSFNFLNKGILQNKQVKPKLKDWIKVNAIVTIIFSAMMLFQVIAVLLQPQLMNQALEQSLAMQSGSQQLSKALLMNMATGMMYFFGIISILLLVHIFFTFRLLKQFKHLFGGSSNDPE